MEFRGLKLHARIKILVLPLLIVFGGLLFNACTAVETTTPLDKNPEGTFVVDLTFREFYNLLGGEKNLGYAISPVFEYQGVRMQYTEKALMKYDPNIPISEQFSLVPVGRELEVNDHAIVLPEQAGLRIVDGYIIYDEFVPMYDSLQGARFVGTPLTQVRINHHRGRIEQYFANLGFYRRLDDPPGKVHLLAYGTWKCESSCSYATDADSLVASFQVFPEPFINSVSRLGSDFMGRPLSEPYLAEDGMLEQIYENFVVYADPANIRTISLRAISTLVGYEPSAPVPNIDDPRLVFYPVEGDLGHLVPTVFEQYIILHGGLEISGPPITDLFAEEELYRQCFTNYCLDYDPAAAETLRIRPTPLGMRYLELFPPRQAAYAIVNFSAQSAHLVISELHPLITSKQEQKVTLQVLDNETQVPIPDQVALLTLRLPDGVELAFRFLPTDASGQSTLTLPGVKAPNGTLVAYEVCLESQEETPMCVSDSYLIWGNP